MNNKELVKNIKSKLGYWQQYVSIFESSNKDIEKNRKEIAQKLMDSPDSEEIKKEADFLFYDYNHNLQDLNQLTQELATLYKIADAKTAEKDFTEEELKKLNSIKEGERKQTFIVEKGNLVERVKGTREQHVKSLKESPMYKQIVNQIKQNLEQ